MAETTIPPVMPMSRNMCEARTNGGDHCFHTQAQPFQNSPTTVIIWSVCCFCAPSYLRQTVLVPHDTDNADMVALQMKHGPLVLVERMQPPPKNQPRILVPADRVQNKH